MSSEDMNGAPNNADGINKSFVDRMRQIDDFVD